MPNVVSVAQREQLYDLARKAGDREQRAYVQTGQLFSGTTLAEAPLHGIMRKLWLALAKGRSLKLSITNADKEWREYATENNEKVSKAPRLKHGPSSGHSVIAHRWVSPEQVESNIPHIYFQFRAIFGESRKD